MGEQSITTEQVEQAIANDQKTIVDMSIRLAELESENQELRELFVYFFGENYEELKEG